MERLFTNLGAEACDLTPALLLSHKAPLNASKYEPGRPEAPPPWRWIRGKVARQGTRCPVKLNFRNQVNNE